MALQLCRENLIEEWRQQDPLLVDADKMLVFIDKRLQAEELLRLIRLCHPDEHGEAITRSEVIAKITCQGLKILEDLGWPREMESYYKFVHTDEVSTLGDALWDCSDDLDPWRTAMHNYEDEITELTNRDFLCLKPQAETEEAKVRCASRGLECTTVKEMRWFLNKYPHTETIVKEALKMHKAFYEHLPAGRHGQPRLLTDQYFRSDECVKNIAGMCRMLGIDVNVLEDTSTMPPRSIDGHVWWILEVCVPATPQEVKTWKEKHPNEEAPDDGC